MNIDEFTGFFSVSVDDAGKASIHPEDEYEITMLPDTIKELKIGQAAGWHVGCRIVEEFIHNGQSWEKRGEWNRGDSFPDWSIARYVHI